MVLLLALPVTVRAQFTYTNINGAITITGYTGSNGVVEVPDWINGYPVRSIGQYALAGGYYAYGNGGYSAVSLTNITLGTNLHNIDFGAFVNNYDLGSMVIPNQVTNIESFAFYQCTGLTNVSIGTNVVSIGNDAFGACASLTNILVPKSVTNIALQAFGQCGNLAAIVVNAQNPVYSSSNGFLFDKQQVTLIEAPGAAAGNFVIPKGVTRIGSWAFMDCTNLGGVTVSNSVTSIDNNAFEGCSGLTNVLIGTNITDIGAYAFTACSGLTSVDIPHGVVRLGVGAFNSCVSLTNISIHSTVTNITSGPLSTPSYGYSNYGGAGGYYYLSTGPRQIALGCPSLTAITVGAQNLYYSSANGIFFNKPQTILIEAPGAIAGNYVVLSTVTNIDGGAFGACTNLTSVIIPKSVTGLGSSAFAGCSGLTNVVIGTNVTSIGDDAFGACSSMTTVTIPASVTNIGYMAFSYCGSLTNVFIGTNVTIIGANAFIYCSSLTSVRIPASVTNIGDSAFAECTSLTNITVDPLNAYYKSFEGVLFNKQKTKLIQVPSGVAGNYTVPDGVTNISYGAFDGCSNLTHVTVGTSVASIGAWEFASCYNLQSVFFKGNAPVITNYFSGGLGGPGQPLNPMPIRRVIVPPIIIGFPYPFYPPIVYYLSGSQGWTNSFLGMTAVPWNFQVQMGGGGLGVRTNRFGFDITGSSNVTIVVEACTNLAKPDWRSVQTNVLYDGVAHFGDAQWTNYPGRYYRFRTE